jgi:hypothetical protein
MMVFLLPSILRKFYSMENVNPFIEPLIYFALGLIVAFVVIPLFILATARTRR